MIMKENENKIPSGNVTFLFTDIEGSTKLSQDFPDLLPHALDRHNEILRNAVESNNGFIFKIIGDAYCCAFEYLKDAVKAAVEAQTDLTNEKWDEAVVKVRMGIHSGNAEWNGNDYMGYITLARAARIMDAAYGEQILISSNTHSLCLEDSKILIEKKIIEKKISKEKGSEEKINKEKNDMNSLSLRDFEVKEISFRDLGERRLKDVIQPIRLYQIVSKGLREDFPPLKTLDARPNNLPIQLTSFIGREEEMKFAKELLKDNRLLTITGTGGAGKTRLSLQTGADMIDDFPNGVWFLELASISDPDYMPIALMNMFGLKEEINNDPEKTLTQYLKNKEILIILDNCEHLIEACAEISAKLLSSCPGLKIMATSREALNIPGEHIFIIPPLSQPDPKKKDTPDQLSQYESVRLFIERALAVNPKFRVTNKNAPAIAGICSNLDGIPLAIELAAARIKVLSPEKIYERLDDIFKLLTGGMRTALPRQQTLRALIDWSYDLLTFEEKILWSRMSVFSCWYTLEAAEEICSDEVLNKNDILDLLSALREKSIIIYDESNERYKLLESIRQYGREKLEKENVIFSKHLDYFLELSLKAKPELKSSNVKKWLDLIEADHNNFLSAIEWGLNNEEAEKGALVADALGRFWEIRGQYSTGIKLLEIILKKHFDLTINTKANILNLAGNLNRYQGNYENAGKYFEESLTNFRETGDKMGISTTINNLGSLAFTQGKFEQAKKFFEESMNIKEEIGDKMGIAGSLNNLGGVAFSTGDYDEAMKYYEYSLSIRKDIGDKHGIAASLNNLGGLELYRGNFKQAKKFFEESLDIKREIGDKKGIASSLGNVGSVAKSQGDFELTKKIYEESLAIFREIGDKQGIANFLNNLGDLVSSQKDYVQALKFYEESLAIFREIGDKQGIASSHSNLGKMAISKGDFETAGKTLEESLTIFKEIGDKHGIALSLFGLGNLALFQKEYLNSKNFLKDCLLIRKEIGDKAGISECIFIMGIIEFRTGDFEKAVKFLSASEKAFETFEVVFDNDDKDLKNETIAGLHEKLSDEVFFKYHEEGIKLSLEEACQLAVSS